MRGELRRLGETEEESIIGAIVDEGAGDGSMVSSAGACKCSVAVQSPTPRVSSPCSSDIRSWKYGSW
jgi:hypothetical protein